MRVDVGLECTTASPIPDSTLDVFCDLECFIKALWHGAASVKLGQYHRNTASTCSSVAWRCYYNLVSSNNGMEAVQNTKHIFG